VSTGFCIVLLAGWGSLLMAMTIRAFEWLRVRAADKSGGGLGLVRLLLAVASFLLIAWGASLIALLMHYSREKGFLIALFAAVAGLAYRGVRDTRRNIAASASPSSPAWIAFALMGSMWLFVTLLLVVWWREERLGLVRGALIWALVAWTTIFIAFLMPWERSRRLLVPAPPAL
jgi:hypothetical protein